MLYYGAWNREEICVEFKDEVNDDLRDVSAVSDAKGELRFPR